MVGQAEATRAACSEQGELTRAACADQVQLNREFLNKLVPHVLDWNLDKWRINELEGLLRFLRRREYLADIAAGKLAIPSLTTAHPVAVHSNDTLHPRGCKNDNSIALRFNRKLYQLLGNRAGMKFLDIGCAGGGFVRTLIDDGHFAVGLEGSDYPQINQTGEWATIPKHLFTCDVTKPFALSDSQTGEPLRFDAITAWELMEHISESDIGPLMANLDNHLAPGGYLMFSISTVPDQDEATGVSWHQTVKPESWWLDRFRQLGFTNVSSLPLGKGDWLRGSGLSRWDLREDDHAGFHVALIRTTEHVPQLGQGTRT